MRKWLALTVTTLLLGVLIGAVASPVLSYGRGLRDYEVCNLSELLYYASHGGVFVEVQTEQEFLAFTALVDVVGIESPSCAVLRFNSGAYAQVPEGEDPPRERVYLALTKPEEWQNFQQRTQQALIRALQQRFGVIR